MPIPDETSLLLNQICNSGFFIGKNMGATSIGQMYNEYPDAWAEYYDKNKLAPYDPVFQWGYFNVGIKRWSELKLKIDIKNVMSQAAKHGLIYGAVLTSKESGKKSILTGARDDREFTDKELVLLSDILTDLTKIEINKYLLTSAEIRILDGLVKGKTFQRIAKEEKVTVSAIKSRSSKAKNKLTAETLFEAIYIATKENII